MSNWIKADSFGKKKPYHHKTELATLTPVYKMGTSTFMGYRIVIFKKGTEYRTVKKVYDEILPLREAKVKGEKIIRKEIEC